MPPLPPKSPFKPGQQPPTGSSPNWGVMILMAVITAILLVAFMFDGSVSGPARDITLDAFTKDYREGLVVTTQPKEFPLIITTNDGSSESTISAYLYKEKPKFEETPFVLTCSDSEEIRSLCNRFGITATPPAGEQPAVETATHLPGSEAFARLAEEGRIVPGTTAIYTLNTGDKAIIGKYRKAVSGKVSVKDVEPVHVTFNRSFQGDEVKALLGNNADYRVDNDKWTAILINCLPVLILLALLIFFFRAQGGGPGGAMKFARSRARLLDPSKNHITFKDVAGISEAKEEVWEIVEFLRNPKKFRNLGGTIPKGVLMVGPPGTGKTLLARAIAGEADVPFYTISGSDFVEMFVGVGASRVRDMFAEAKKNAPCLIFIDEIDAVGRHRGHGVGGGHDEREQTLNALLVEMDGFTANENVIVIAATNRVDVLDPALLRPGRFDRQVTVNLPDAAGREQILKVHARKIKMDESVDLGPIARATTGFSGAELANLVNEAALIAARKNQSTVQQADLEEAREKVRWGRERRSLEITEKEKRNTAIHEAGHAVCLLKTALAKSLPLHKVTIIPRGPALGVTMMLPEEDKHSEYESEMHDYIVMAMGGRCAEQVINGDVTGGASGDIHQATAIARKMVCVYGMSPKLGTVEYASGHSEVFLARDLAQGRSFSEHTAQIIDEEVHRIVSENYERALAILTENKERLLLIADKLIEFETLSGKQVAELLETGEMSNPPQRELPPELPAAPEAPDAPPTTDKEGEGEDIAPAETESEE